MEQRVTVSIDGGVADVRLNRPDKINALDGAMFEAIVSTGEELKADKSVRAVVLSGEGRGFCAGLDFGSFQAMAGGGGGGGGGGAAPRPRPPRDEAKNDNIGRTDGRITHHAQQACWVWQESRCPSSLPCTASPSVGDANSRSAPTFASWRPTRGCRCSRSAGVSSRT